MNRQLILPISLVERRKKLGIMHTSLEWPLSILFGKPVSKYWLWAVSMYDFEMEHYIYMLDNVESREQLVSALQELSPLADDALSVAEWMTSVEFAEFREIVPRHHQAVREGVEPQEEVPEQFLKIMLPDQFLYAIPLAEKGVISLGVALVRSWEVIFSKKRHGGIIHSAM